jgi:tyrosinase
MSHVIISGGSTPGGGTPNRLEINTLIQDQVQFSLYIQALSKLLFWTYLLPNRFIDGRTDAMFARPSSDPLSHFSIGGIHGLPYVQWEGAGGTSPVPGTGWDGYCTHGSYLFPTWHRPYVALYEVGGS